jgi:putative pyruvate formate lyase activating enzyme
MFKIARAAKHYYEEPVISGQNGSGAIFFSGCNLNCVFCQNFEISHGKKGIEVDEEQLAAIMLHLQEQGAHNINLVTPSLYVERLRLALIEAKEGGLKIPVVYNTSAYERVETLEKLQGLIDIYLPDLKFADNQTAARYTCAPNYFDVAIKAIAEMRRQQPDDIFNGDFIMQRGVIVRHLILPSNIQNSKKVFEHIAALDKSLYVSVMSQYFVPKAADLSKFPELSRRITQEEYDTAMAHFFSAGLYNGFTQDLDSAVEEYVPDFDTRELELLLKSLKK